MSELILWKNQQINKLRRDMNRLFERCWSDFGVSLFVEKVSEDISIEMTETDDTLIVKATLEGINPEDLDISVTYDALTISGKKKKKAVEDSSYYYRVERTFSSFERTIQLPCRVDVENTEAIYKEGILKIILPKQSPEKVQRIRIKVKTT